MAEAPVEEVINEIDLRFFVQLVRVKTWNAKYNELRLKVENGKSRNQLEESFTAPEDYSVPAILKRIQRLYGEFVLSRNEKLAEGAREEILSLIGILIWKLNPK
jgi:hypothetical protein